MSQARLVTAYVALGSNLGQREEHLRKALELLGTGGQVTVTCVSSFYENPAVGGPAGSPDYLNGVAEVQTSLQPLPLLHRLLAIEAQMGRVRRVKWESRVIDLDLLLYGDQVIDMPELKVPHPLMHQRRFVLQPLAEIAPDVVHPILQQSIAGILRQL